MKIDFVIMWVDGQDEAWLNQKREYLPSNKKDDNGVTENRFRDWGLLPYWFRGIEANAPWVHRIYFVTWGHVPSWLNVNHKKLRIVRHEDFMPKEYLPTFNSSAIVLNLHRIKGLSEQFVLFNDDMFLMKKTKPGYFFKNGLPHDAVLMDAVTSVDVGDVFPHLLLNNAAVINKYFSKKKVLKRYWWKFFSLRYGTDLVRSLLMAPLKRFTAFRSQHNPVPLLKSSFTTVWEKETNLLENASSHRFRHREDLNEWLFRDWCFCEGRFVPRSTRRCRCYELGMDSIDKICDAIRNSSYQTICINDSSEIVEFEKMQQLLKDSFEYKFGEKSSYEL